MAQLVAHGLAAPEIQIQTLSGVNENEQIFLGFMLMSCALNGAWLMVSPRPLYKCNGRERTSHMDCTLDLPIPLYMLLHRDL